MQDWGPSGFTAADRYDSATITMGYGTQTDTLKGFYTGWGLMYPRMQWLNTVWLPNISAQLWKLTWRDAYSYHYTTDQTWIEDWTKVPRSRPLPSWAEVKSLQAFDRYGRMDSAMNTFVELGFFDTLKGTTHLQDTHYVFVVNRRTFERTDDIALNGPDSLLARHLDSLADVRRLRIRFNLERHPDTTQYCFLHIREVTPDETTLPGESFPRKGLDTVIWADSAANLTLRPGGGALLQITYAPPDSSIINGALVTSNQRKLVFDGRRYHMTYFAPDTMRIPDPSIPGKIDTEYVHAVYYRRSFPVTSGTGSILWEPFTQKVSCDTAEDMRRDNFTPSITYRTRFNDSTLLADTVITIVWTNYSTSAGSRRIWLRNLTADNYGGIILGPYEYVDAHAGANPLQWGTPVVCRMNGGDVIAWSDSTLGIVARFRRQDTNSNNWWTRRGTYSSRDMISQWFQTTIGAVEQFPTMPAFAHVTSLDSNAGIAWQWRPRDTTFKESDIIYAHLADTTIGGAPSIKNLYVPQMLNKSGFNGYHPSMDLWQEGRKRAYEGVTWEEIALTKPSNPSIGYRTRLVFQSLYTPTNARPGWDSVELTQIQAQGKLIVADSTHDTTFVYPNTASLNQAYLAADSNETNYFSIVYRIPSNGLMRQAEVPFNSATFAGGFPKTYLYGGVAPTGSASAIRQDARHAVVYEDHTYHTSAVRTTRQFFAKLRPDGYMASGREAVVPVDDSSRTAFALVLHDVWRADPNGGYPMRLAERGSNAVRTDSMVQVNDLLRTQCFTTHDSVTFGCTIDGRLIGPDSIAAGMHVDAFLELMDSASGSVVATLDSFTISAASPDYQAAPETTFDLLSGTYYIRLRLVPYGLPVVNITNDSRYPVTELASEVGSVHAGKVRAVEHGASQLRLAVQPNLVVSETQILFSVAGGDAVSLALFDAAGHEMKRIIDGETMDDGRYAVDVDTHALVPGTYLIELRSGEKRSVAKMVVMR
ncbi:MAG: T9SS type A sorting domain-containing protein [Bacteroidetes bacterium]|nr:T9SS type A sorting domain-containing protein [Bacteroidota bacterium]